MPETEIQDLAPGPRTIPELPEYQLHPIRLSSLGELQERFRANHLRSAFLAGASLPRAARAELLESANQYIASGVFRVMREGFISSMFDAANLPFLLMLCIRPGKLDITEATCAKLIGDPVIAGPTDARVEAIQGSCLELSGFTFNRKKNAVAATSKTPENPTTGTSTGSESSAG